MDFDNYSSVLWSIYELDPYNTSNEIDHLKDFMTSDWEKVFNWQNRAIWFANRYAQENKVPVHIMFTAQLNDGNVDNSLDSVIYVVKPYN